MTASGYGDGAGGGQGDRGLAVRHPGRGIWSQVAGCRGGPRVALRAGGRADRQEEPVSWRQAHGWSQEIEARSSESSRLTGAGKFNFLLSFIHLFFGCDSLLIVGVLFFLFL